MSHPARNQDIFFESDTIYVTSNNPSNKVVVVEVTRHHPELNDEMVFKRMIEYRHLGPALGAQAQRLRTGQLLRRSNGYLSLR